MHTTSRVGFTSAALAILALGTSLNLSLEASDVRGQAGCRLTGTVLAGTSALPGVALVVRLQGEAVAVTSTGPDGRFAVTVPGAATFELTAELMGFVAVTREVVAGPPPCEIRADLSMTLTSRSAGASLSATTPSAASPTAPAAGPRAGFQTLDVQTDATGAAALQLAPPDLEAAAATMQRLLPPGFSTDGPTDAVALNGNVASIDRGMLGNRLDAIGRGEIDPVTGQLVAGPDGEATGGPQLGRGRGGRGQGAPGGAGGPGRFGLGGRGRGQQQYSFNSNYSIGGSAFDAAPYQLRPDNPVNQSPYTRQTFSVTAGGPLRIPGLYDGTQRTTFNVTYSGNRGSNLYEQYATVPTLDMRAGDFSALQVPIIDPGTGAPFADNRIPTTEMDAAALALLRFVPEPNLPGTSRNYYYSTTTQGRSDNLNVQVNHRLAGVGGGRGARGGGPGGGGRGGRGGRAGTSVNLSAQLQYRRNTSDLTSVFPTLAGRSRGSSLSLPVGLTIQQNRNAHAINLSLTRSTSRSTNQYAFVEDVAGAAGIAGVSTDPFDWGVPNLNFATFSDLRDITPSRRIDSRFGLSYTWTRPTGLHTLRFGGDYRRDSSESQTDTSARGDFLFTGLYAAGSSAVTPGGLDFADYLLGLPQQASLQYGPGTLVSRGRSLSLFLQDDWRARGNLTVSLGVRYELIWPFEEANGRMVTLDVNDDFTAAVPVVSGGVGPFSGDLPGALVRLDRNNIAPRLGLAWRMAPGTIVRTGYGVSYNSGSYSSIARQLTAQPPFATAGTTIGTLDAPLHLTDAFGAVEPTTVTNTYGIDPDYQLGVVQTWNADLSRSIGQVWEVGGGYTGTRGSHLDMVRAPNRGPDGPRIPDVQPFTWQTSEAASMLHAGTLRLTRRPAGGIGGGVSYTLARSRDNASTLGGGRTTVAQNDQDLQAEWGLSSFDRRHQLSANLNLELPFGENRRWLTGGGFWAALAADWRAAVTFTSQSGTPYTPTVAGAAADAASGVNGTLRADYTGAPIQVPDPTIDRFFNTAAFAIPVPGAFGTAGRNVIIGPGSRQLDASFSRDVRLGGFRSLTIDVRATNLLNLVNYVGLNTNVNSPSFGQITSVRPMRSMTMNFRVRF